MLLTIKRNNFTLFFRCSKFSSFNQAMDDAEEWTVFAPIARLESLDELDQVNYLLYSSSFFQIITGTFLLIFL